MSVITDSNTINELVSKYVDGDPDEEAANTPPFQPTMPPSCEVELIAGLNLPSELIMTAEVREFTGRDEEAFARLTHIGKLLPAVLERGVVKLGDKKATPELLDMLLAGDRDWLMLHIYRATFGPEATANLRCPSCNEDIEVIIDVVNDVTVKPLEDQMDRRFTLDTKQGNATVDLPNGVTQKALLAATDKSFAEMSTILLQHCVSELNGMPIMNKNKILDFTVADRRALAEEITKRAPGPDLLHISTPCPACGEGVETPINVGALFRF